MHEYAFYMEEWTREPVLLPEDLGLMALPVAAILISLLVKFLKK